MFIVHLASYIFFITIIIFLATRILWLVFFLFSYRFFESILPVSWFQQHIDLVPGSDYDYYILLIIITAITYFAVMISTRSIPILKYFFLLAVTLYVLRKYQFADVFFFRDYLQAHGMWSLQYWIDEIRSVFIGTSAQNKGIIWHAWDVVLGTIKHIWGYIYSAK
jgi:hypothetical protein